MAEAPQRRSEEAGSSRGGNPPRKAAGASRNTTSASKSPAKPRARSTTKRAPSTRALRARAPRTAPAEAVTEEQAGNGWLELVASVVQAPVGMGRAQAERLVGELVKTGNLGQREAERLLNDLRSASERAQGRAQSAADGLDKFIENRIEDVLNRVNIPSRSDIDRLNRSVDILTAKVEALLSRQERRGR